jgi:uncharacterized caspase-like protein
LRKLPFLDTCHSGQVLPGVRAETQQADVDKFASDLASAEAGVVVFCSSTGKQFSLELEQPWQHGAFTGALLEAFQGKADYDPDQNITTAELEVYLGARVKELTGGKQKPTVAKPSTMEDIPIFRVIRP